MRRANVLIVILLASLALVLIACGKDSEDGSAASTETAPAQDQAPPTTPSTTVAVQPRTSEDGCRAVPRPTPSSNPDRRRSRRRLDRSKVYIATVKTNCGTIRIRLAVKRAPKTTAAFAGLARNTFFDGLTFHRIAKPGGNDFVIQGGDPLGTGNGGPGYTVVEAPPKNTRYRRYVVAMAKTAAEPAGSSGSQFFIVTAEDAGLPPDYAILGEVVGGKDAVKRIAAVPTDPATEAPIDPVVMSSVRISTQTG